MLYKNFGKGTTELANQFTTVMTQMRAGFAKFLQSTGAGKFLLERMTFANLYRQGMASDDPALVEARKLKRAIEVEGSLFRPNKEQKLWQSFLK